MGEIHSRKVIVRLHRTFAQIEVLHPFEPGKRYAFKMPREQWDVLAVATISARGMSLPLFSGFEPGEVPADLVEVPL